MAGTDGKDGLGVFAEKVSVAIFVGVHPLGSSIGSFGQLSASGLCRWWGVGLRSTSSTKLVRPKTARSPASG